jgi:hypothetical protein
MLVAGLLAGAAGPVAGAPPRLPPFDRTMTLQRVEPHVVRVLDDGAGHDLTDIDTFEDRKPVSLLAAGDDGSVWMTSSGGFIELGVPGEVPDPLDTFLAQMEIGPDGALWIADGRDGSSIARWFEGAWEIHELPADAWVVWLDAKEDGGLDFSWRNETTLSFGALQPGADGWIAASPPPLPLVSPDGQVVVERTSDGRLWVAESPFWQEEQRFEPGPLWTLDGSEWRRVAPLGDLPVQPRTLTVEASGALRVTWLEIVPRTSMPGPTHLTRLEGDGDWTIVTPVEADTDERLGGCRGYYELDGERLTRYLDGLCLRPAAITPTGEVWVFGHDEARRDAGVYIITPDR